MNRARREVPAVAAAAAVAGDGAAQIAEARAGHVAPEVEAAHVMVGAVGAGDRAGERGDLRVGEDVTLPALRPGEADRGAGHLAHHGVGGEAHALEAGERGQLALVDGAVAAHQRHQRPIVVG